MRLLPGSGRIQAQLRGAIINKTGLLRVVWLLPLLAIGAAIRAIGLMKEQFISKWQGVCIVLGLLSLNNPDIEFISSIGALLMCAGYIPLGIKTFQAE